MPIFLGGGHPYNWSLGGGGHPDAWVSPVPPPAEVPPRSSSGDALGLQVDYWGAPMGAERRREGERREGGAKTSLRGTFRSLHVSRLPGAGDPPGSTLAMTLVTREKNKKGEGGHPWVGGHPRVGSGGY